MSLQTGVFIWIVCVLLQGALFTPLVLARGIRCITALLLLLASASLCTLSVQLLSGSLSTATFSLPAFSSGLLLALALLLLAPSILLLGLSSLLLVSLLSSFLSTCLLYLYSRVPLLGFEYDADGALHFSAFVLTTLVGGCAIGCLLVAIAGRLTAEEEQRTSNKESAVLARAQSGNDEAYVDIDSLQQAEEEDGPSEQFSLNQQPTSSLPTAPSAFSGFSSSTLCWPLPISVSSLLKAALSSHHLSKASVRLSLGFVTCLLSSLLYCLHLVPIYATQRDGVLRIISLNPYILSLHLGLASLILTVCPLILYAASSLSKRGQSVLLSPMLTVGCCVCGGLSGFVYWWLLGYMPAHSHIQVGAVIAEYEWYFYSIGSDALTVASWSAPRFTLTALAWAVSKEHRIPIASSARTGRRASREEMQELNSESVEESDGQQQEEDGRKQVSSRASGSTMSLWCLALVLGAVSDGVAAFAWDEGY